MIRKAWRERQQTTSNQRPHDHRTPYQRDRARILHSAAFRRLQAKTQVHGIGLSDFYRTRLTHSLETAQIGAGLLEQLRQKCPEHKPLLDSRSLIEANCLAHDLGHPPFGHGGEIALNYMMSEHGGFEGNGQTFRIMTRLEPYTEHCGMNLSRRTLLGILKYPNTLPNLIHTVYPEKSDSFRSVGSRQWLPPKGVYQDDQDTLEWLLAPLCASDRELFQSFKSVTPQARHRKTRFKSFDCSMMELADDIAYSVHDLEDAVVMGLVNIADWKEHAAEPIAEIGDNWLSRSIQFLTDKLFSGIHHQQKDAIGAMVNAFITQVEIVDQNLMDDCSFEEVLLRYNAALPSQYCDALEILKQFVFNYVIRKPELQLLEYKGQQIVMELFEAFASDPERLLPVSTRELWHRAEEQENSGKRVIADYISALTDASAHRIYRTLFLPDHLGSHERHNI